MRLLIGALGDGRWDVRRAAAEALGEIGAKEAVPSLVGKLGKEEWWAVRVAMMKALEKITGERLGEERKKWVDWWRRNCHNYKRFGKEGSVREMATLAFLIGVVGGGCVFLAVMMYLMGRRTRQMRRLALRLESAFSKHDRSGLFGNLRRHFLLFKSDYFNAVRNIIRIKDNNHTTYIFDYRMTWARPVDSLSATAAVEMLRFTCVLFDFGKGNLPFLLIRDADAKRHESEEAGLTRLKTGDVVFDEKFCLEGSGEESRQLLTQLLSENIRGFLLRQKELSPTPLPTLQLHNRYILLHKPAQLPPDEIEETLRFAKDFLNNIPEAVKDKYLSDSLQS